MHCCPYISAPQAELYATSIPFLKYIKKGEEMQGLLKSWGIRVIFTIFKVKYIYANVILSVRVPILGNETHLLPFSSDEKKR